MNKKIIGFLIYCAIISALYGLSWIITCGIFKAITLCFGWTFSWKVSTGIWLIICFVKLLFNKKGEKND